MTNELSTIQRAIIAECDALKEMLLEKNKAYGNSAMDPVRIFSKASKREQILVRLDDKLSRLARGTMSQEDVVQDLLGYLILLRIGDKEEKPEPLPVEDVARGSTGIGSTVPLDFDLIQPCDAWARASVGVRVAMTPPVGCPSSMAVRETVTLFSGETETIRFMGGPF